MYWCHVPDLLGGWVPAIHANCVHNEVAALLLRTLGPTPVDPGSPFLKDEYATLRKLARKLGVARWTRERVVSSFR